MYFKRFPTIYYPVTINGVNQYSILKDVTINVRFVKEFLSNITLYDLYDIVDGETPEIISEKFYGTPLYHWIVMIVNERYDYINDFPLPYDQLVSYVKDKYGEENMYNAHHYENAQGYIVNPDEPFAKEITNFDYEEKLNESKRTIKIISRSIVETVVKEFIKMIK